MVGRKNNQKTRKERGLNFFVHESTLISARLRDKFQTVFCAAKSQQQINATTDRNVGGLRKNHFLFVTRITSECATTFLRKTERAVSHLVEHALALSLAQVVWLTHTHARTRSQTYTRTHAHAHAHRHTHARKRTHTRARTHFSGHKHTLFCLLAFVYPSLVSLSLSLLFAECARAC